MSGLSLDVHGIRVVVEGDDDALRGIARQFEAFIRPERGAPDVTIRVSAERPALDLPEGTAADQIVDRGLVYNLGATTVVDHHGHATSRYDFAREQGRVEAESVADRVELAYLMISSRLGEKLEARGLVRVHGVGFAVGGRAALVLAPSGGGKSTLARALLRRPDVLLLGDDLVLLDRRGFVVPFPTPIGLTDPAQANGLGEPVPFPRRLHPPKWVLPIEGFGARVGTAPVPLAAVVVLRRVVGRRAALREVGRDQVAGALFRDAIVGLGLPQVLELVARRGVADLPRLVPSALTRTRAVAMALGRSRAYVLDAGPPEQAADRLVSMLLSQAGSR